MLYANWLHGTEDITPAKQVRDAVFVNEQGYKPEDEYDNYDAMAWHVVAMDDETPVGTGRVYLQDGKFHVGRICVLPEYRGNGIGDAIIRLLLDRALMAGAQDVTIASQVYIKDAYKKFGFQEVGEPYTLPGDTRQHIDLYAKAEDIQFPHACAGGCAGCSGCGGD